MAAHHSLSQNQFGYHVSDPANHESIMEHGLDAGRAIEKGYSFTGQASGQYLYGSRGSANTSAVRDFVNAHVYEVNITGLNAERDPNMGDALRIADTVEPSRIRLHGRTVTSPSSRHGKRVIPVKQGDG